MANKPLQSIQFPGLPSKYTVPQMDSNFDGVSGKIPDSKKVHDEIDSLKEDLNDIDDRVTALEQGGTGGVSTSVRQALLTLLKSAAYTETGLSDEIATIESWATEITALSVSPSTASISGSGTQQLTATTTPTGGTVTWSSSNTAVATVSSNGLVTGVSNGTAIITATSGDAHASCTITVSGIAALVSIDATYTQTGTVTPEDSLSDLTSDLVVVATYDNSDTVTLTSDQYTLSGTLTVGTSTITVSYGGKTDTVTVTVTSDLLYYWDLTSSLTDSVGGVVASTNGTRDSNGLSFSAAGAYVEFPGVYQRDRTYVIDVKSIDKASPNKNGRLFMVDADSNTGSGGTGYILTGTGKGGDLFYIYNSGWESSNIIVDNTTDADGSYYDDSTMGFYLDDDGYCSVYKDGILLGTSSGVFSADYNGKNVYIGSAGNTTEYLYNAVFTGIRVYDGNKYD